VPCPPFIGADCPATLRAINKYTSYDDETRRHARDDVKDVLLAICWTLTRDVMSFTTTTLIDNALVAASGPPALDHYVPLPRRLPQRNFYRITHGRSVPDIQ